MTGDFLGKLDFTGCTPLAAPPDQAMFVAHVGSDGACIEMWSFEPTAIGSQSSGHAIAVGADGHVFVGGIIKGKTTKLGTSTGDSDAVVFKLGDDGVAWRKQIAGMKDASFDALALDATDNVYVGGFSGTDVVFAKYTTHGTVLWKRTAASNDGADATGAAIGQNGVVAFAGTAVGHLTLDEEHTLATQSAFIAMLDAETGMPEHSAVASNAATSAATGLAYDPLAGSFVLSAKFSGTNIVFGNLSASSNNGIDSSIVERFSAAAAGTAIHSLTAPAGSVYVDQVAGLTSGEVAMSVRYDAAFDFFGSPIASPGTPATMLGVVHADLGSYHFVVPNDAMSAISRTKVVATGSNDDLIIAGKFVNNAGFGGKGILVAGPGIVLAKIDYAPP